MADDADDFLSRLIDSDDERALEGVDIDELPIGEPQPVPKRPRRHNRVLDKAQLEEELAATVLSCWWW